MLNPNDGSFDFATKLKGDISIENKSDEVLFNIFKNSNKKGIAYDKSINSEFNNN